MNKKNKVIFIIEELENLFPEVPIPLNHKDPFTLLIAVLLSAQCTDERVNLITPKLFKIADNPLDMSRLSINDIKETIRPCGLSPMKSKGIRYKTIYKNLFQILSGQKIQGNGLIYSGMSSNP